MSEISVLQPDQWQLYKAVHCAALADAPYAFSGTLENALQRSDEEWAVMTFELAISRKMSPSLPSREKPPVGCRLVG